MNISLHLSSSSIVYLKLDYGETAFPPILCGVGVINLLCGVGSMNHGVCVHRFMNYFKTLMFQF